MAKFEGQLWLAGEPSSVIDVEIHTLTDRLLVVSEGEVIGDWLRKDITVDRSDDTVQIHAEGVDIVLTSEAPGFAAAVLGAPTAAVGLAARVRSAATLQAVGADRPWWQSWWAIALGGVALIAVVANLGGDPAEPEAVGATTVPTTSLAETTTTNPPTTTTTPQTTTSQATTGTVGLPDVPQAQVIFGPPTAGPSGDPAASPPADSEPATITAIQDGDTLEVSRSDGTTDTVRLIGINSPESSECWASEATLALASLTPFGSDIAISQDTSDRDQFGRLLRYVWIGSFSVNEELVRRGAAISRRYAPDTTLAARFESAQAAAQQAGIGLWAPDACGPAADATLEIVEIHYDAPGDDNTNLNEEWVSVRNRSSNLVDLTGWGIKDESASNRYNFPTGFTLAAGDAVTIFSGCGDDFGTSLFWCSVGSAIWNNSGDTVFITDSNGNTHTSQTYTPPTTTTQTPTTTAATSGGGNCHSSYPDVCIPPPPPDLDCGDITHRRFTVVGSDPHRFDGDNDGIGCES